MSSFLPNVSVKVNRAISGATTVNASCYAIVTYRTTGTSNNSYNTQQIFNRYFGPAQSIPASFTTVNYDGGVAISVTYTLQHGVEFINTP